MSPDVFCHVHNSSGSRLWVGVLQDAPNRGQTPLNIDAQTSRPSPRDKTSRFCLKCVCVYVWVCVWKCYICCSVQTHIPSGSKPCPSCAKINPPWTSRTLHRVLIVTAFDFSPSICRPTNQLTGWVQVFARLFDFWLLISLISADLYKLIHLN